MITQSGIQYTIFDSVIYNPYIEVLNGVYEYQIEIQDNMDLTPYINCLSSFLIVESPTLNKGIDLTFKRVPHYNEHNDKDRLILNLVHQKKSLREIKHLLSKNFKLSIEQSETAINTCLQNAQTEISVFGKQKTKIPNLSVLILNHNSLFWLFLVHVVARRRRASPPEIQQQQQAKAVCHTCMHAYMYALSLIHI